MPEEYDYYLAWDNNPYKQVTKTEWVHAERQAGFRNTMGQPNEPATSSFGGNVAGRRVKGTHRTAGSPPPE